MSESDNPSDPKWDPTSRWIVIINKKPHGPLTREEIRVLLAQGVLRTNDVAFLVRAENVSTKRADWKFLWQFDEFDRRRGSIAVKEPERRSIKVTPPPDPVHLLPEEYASISPEDLILKTRTLPQSDKSAEVETNASHPASGPSPSGGRSPWIVGLGLSFAVAIAVFFFRAPSRRGSPVADNTRTETPPANTLPTRSLLNSGAMRLPTSTQAPQAPAAPPTRASMPAMKEESGRVRGERGAVPYDPDEEALQAAEEEEAYQAAAEEEEAAEDSAFEDRKPARKKVAKRRRPKAPVREEASTPEEDVPEAEADALDAEAEPE